MGHRSVDFNAHQGWCVDMTHPSRHILSLETIFDHLSNLYPTHEAESTAKKSWIRDVESFVQVHIEEVLSTKNFIRAPMSAVQRILSLPCNNTTEDFILERVLKYAADAANVLADSPAFWTEDERELVLPVLLQLFPYIRIFSLSTDEFLHTVEPMKILDTQELIQKYKFDALARQLNNEGTRNQEGHSLASIKRCYKEPKVRREILYQRLRGSIALSESAHPYYEGEGEVLEEVAVTPWAPRVLVEFDRRSCIGIGAQLTFYRDPDARDVIGTWHDMWPRGRHGVKSFVVKGHRLFVGFRSCFCEETKWGWKMLVVPLFQPQDFD